MRDSPKVLLAAVAVLVGCGAPGEGGVDPTGSEVCLPDESVCIDVPSGGIAERVVLRISPSQEAPPAALSPSFDISPVPAGAVTFLLPATVSFSLSLADAGLVPSESLLRVYTLEDGQWVPLSSPSIDRVKGRVQGQVMHLSPFVILRADRLPDGGLPQQLDAGAYDASVVLPPFDAGSVVHDAGVRDAGTPDAGLPDAGPPDAGVADAGPADAGTADAGLADAGAGDAGQLDAGTTPDAGPADAGDADAGLDAGVDDAGADAGPGDAG